ncbi:MAG: response regulator [Cyanobacteria bacterium P01_F01_bin.13]
MADQFEIISFLNGIIASQQNGRVQIVGKGVEWCFDIIDGRLLFAAHSLQYLTALETVLPSLGYEAALPVYWRLIRSNQYKHQGGAPDLESLGWASRIVGALVQYEALSLQQAEKTLAKLAEDALESLLGLEAAKIVWYPAPKECWHLTTQGVPISSLVNHLSERLRAWQPLCDRICSPHQRPYCEDPDKLHQPIPQGLLSQQMLEALARLMQGASIRQLSQAVKQDEVTLAKLLYPYIQQRVIKLWPPVQPLDRLPWLPGKKLPVTSSVAVAQPMALTNPEYQADATTTHQLPAVDPLVTRKPRAYGMANNSRPASGLVVNNNSGSDSTNSLTKRPSAVAKERHVIICIDDSKAMLEKIESYLDPRYFDLKTIIDPVASVSKICAVKPDLVLMDVSMPSINGNSLCEILKRSYVFKEVPIIMISSNVSPLNKATAQAAGATDYLEKPFSKTQLMKVLETYLETQFSF